MLLNRILIQRIPSLRRRRIYTQVVCTYLRPFVDTLPFLIVLVGDLQLLDHFKITAGVSNIPATITLVSTPEQFHTRRPH